MDTKMVIVWRKDLNVRKGKCMADAAHAGIAWIISRLQESNNKPKFSNQEEEWMYGGMTKITLQVENEQELIDIFQKAKSAGLLAFLIKDAGKTEFGEPTNCCIGIGPNLSSEIDKITSNLKLY